MAQKRDNHFDTDLLLEYVSDRVTDTTAKEIVAHLTVCEQCAEIVEELKAARQTNADHGKFARATPSQPFYQRPWFWWSAGVVVLLGGLCWWGSGPAEDYSDLLEAQFEVLPLEGITHASEVQKDLFYPGKVQYDKQDYGRAAAKFEVYLKELPGDGYVRFYTGLAYLSDGQYGKAVPHFEYLIDQGDPVYGYSSRWYMGLAHLGMGHGEYAKEAFGELARMDGVYQEKAREVLMKIEDRD